MVSGHECPFSLNFSLDLICVKLQAITLMYTWVNYGEARTHKNCLVHAVLYQLPIWPNTMNVCVGHKEVNQCFLLHVGVLINFRDTFLFKACHT